MNSAALYDALNLASLAVFLGEAGQRDRAQLTLIEASIAADRAFPAGSPEAGALAVVLDAAAKVPEVTG